MMTSELRQPLDFGSETETEIKIELSGDVLFGFDSADIRAEAEPVLVGPMC